MRHGRRLVTWRGQDSDLRAGLMRPHVFGVGGQTHLTWAVRGRNTRTSARLTRLLFPDRSPRNRPSRAKSCPLRTPPAPPSIHQHFYRGERFYLALLSHFSAFCGPFAV
jgi:hypothetical protein